MAESFARPHSFPEHPGSTPCPGPLLPLPFCLLLRQFCDSHWHADQHISTHQTAGQAAPAQCAVRCYLCVLHECLRSGSSERKGRLSASVFRPPAARSLFIFPRPRTRQRGRAARPTASSLPPSHPTARWAFFASLAQFRFPCSLGPGVGRQSHWTIPPPDPDDR